MIRLHQVLALVKSVKPRAYAAVTEMHKRSQREELFVGISKEYTPKDEEGEVLSPQKNVVQLTAQEVLDFFPATMSEAWDLEATKDWGNMAAKADIVIDNVVLVPDVPVTFLLHLEKQLKDFRTYVDKMPVMDPSKAWKHELPVSKTEPISTQRTQKKQVPIVLYDATPEHPAQTQLVSEDIVVGHWMTTHLSGAITWSRKKDILSRLDALAKAVKMAREEANNTTCDRKEVAKPIFDFLLS